MVFDNQTDTDSCATDQNDESLKKWKASLGLGQGKDISDPNDPRKCIIHSLGLEVDGRPDIIIDLKAPGAVEALQKQPFTIKEGATFRMKAQFQVQHEILAGLKYLQKVSRMGVPHRMQEMMVCLAMSCIAMTQQHANSKAGFIWSQHRGEAPLREEMYVLTGKPPMRPMTDSPQSNLKQLLRV